MSEPAKASLSYDEYLALERAGEVKHELLDGIARAMPGVTLEHARLAARFARALGEGLRGRPCETFSSDARVRIDASNRSTYPDLAVVCGKLERSTVDAEAITNPVVLVEVMSDSTEAHDRGDKHVLVSQHEPFVEVWRRDGEAWRVSEHGPGSAVHERGCQDPDRRALRDRAHVMSAGGATRAPPRSPALRWREARLAPSWPPRS